MIEYLKDKAVNSNIGSEKKFYYFFAEFKNADSKYLNKDGIDLFNMYCMISPVIQIKVIAEIVS